MLNPRAWAAGIIGVFEQARWAAWWRFEVVRHHQCLCVDPVIAATALCVESELPHLARNRRVDVHLVLPGTFEGLSHSLLRRMRKSFADRDFDISVEVRPCDAEAAGHRGRHSPRKGICVSE